MDREELRTRLDAVVAVDEVRDHRQAEELQQLLEHPALPTLWSLMLGARQAQYAILANSPLGGMEQVTRASVIQGTIKGIEMFYETALEQAVPSHTSGEKE